MNKKRIRTNYATKMVNSKYYEIVNISASNHRPNIDANFDRNQNIVFAPYLPAITIIQKNK